MLPTVLSRTRGWISDCDNTVVCDRNRSTIERTNGRMPGEVTSTGASPIHVRVAFFVFAVGTLLSALAPNLVALIALRALTGGCAAAMSTVGRWRRVII